MSGQNIGNWIRPYDIECASEGFKAVSIIATRDNTFSKAALADIGIEGSHIFSTHDDALFIKESSKNISQYILKRVELQESQKFISLSLHLEEGTQEIIQEIRRNTDLPILIVPTCPPDQKVQKMIYLSALKNNIKDIYIVKKLHSHSEVKGIISCATVCVSSRHHPIIFALGHSVPCVSINLSPYFNKKNYGAMELCNVENNSYDYEDRDFSHSKMFKLREALSRVLNEHRAVSDTISRSHQTLKDNKNKFLLMVKEIYDTPA